MSQCAASTSGSRKRKFSWDEQIYQPYEGIQALHQQDAASASQTRWQQFQDADLRPIMLPAEENPFGLWPMFPVDNSQLLGEESYTPVSPPYPPPSVLLPPPPKRQKLQKSDFSCAPSVPPVKIEVKTESVYDNLGAVKPETDQQNVLRTTSPHKLSYTIGLMKDVLKPLTDNPEANYQLLKAKTDALINIISKLADFKKGMETLTEARKDDLRTHMKSISTAVNDLTTNCENRQQHELKMTVTNDIPWPTSSDPEIIRKLENCISEHRGGAIFFQAWAKGIPHFQNPLNLGPYPDMEDSLPVPKKPYCGSLKITLSHGRIGGDVKIPRRFAVKVELWKQEKNGTETLTPQFDDEEPKRLKLWRYVMVINSFEDRAYNKSPRQNVGPMRSNIIWLQNSLPGGQDYISNSAKEFIFGTYTCYYHINDAPAIERGNYKFKVKLLGEYDCNIGESKVFTVKSKIVSST